MSDAHHRELERIYRSAPVNASLAPRILVTDGACEIRITVGPEHHHAAGAVHGSVTFKLLDDAAYFAVNSAIEDVLVMTVSFHVQFLRPVSQGELTARGRLVRRTRTVSVGEATVLDGEGREIGRGSGDFAPSRITMASLREPEARLRRSNSRRSIS